MRIKEEECVGCGLCIPYCPVGAIKMDTEAKRARIDKKNCLECGTCGRDYIVKCPKEAIEETEDVKERPRSIRKFFSDPMAYHAETKVPGRGTEEVKTNDVTGRVRRGYVGIAVEVGRPCLGASLEDVEKITTALARTGVSFEKDNPLTYLMEDEARGEIIKEVREERVISAIIEMTIPMKELDSTLKILMQVSEEIDTVFSLDLITRYRPDGTIPVFKELENSSIEPRINAKVNLGLGKPIKEV